jgi:hypothetical protein
LSTSLRKRVLSVESDCAEDSTLDDATPVSPAPRLTSAMLVAIPPIPHGRTVIGFAR